MDFAAATRVFGALHEAGPPAPPGAPALPGYLIEAELGSGGSAVVYRAVSRSTGRRVALKITRAPLRDPAAADLAWRELGAIERIRSRVIPQLIDYGEHAGRFFLATELVNGVPITRYADDRMLGASARVGLMALVCQAVQTIHEHGVIHRDLKPANVLITSEGQPVVIDLGLGCTGATASGAGAQLETVGTPGYMAPEQAAPSQSGVSTRTDIYALGALTRRLLRGRRGAPPPPIPKALRAIIAKATAADPAARYASAASLGEDLRRYLEGGVVEAVPAPRWVKACRRVVQRPWVPPLLVGVGVVLLAFSVYAHRARASLERELAMQRDLIAASIDDVLNEVYVFVGTVEARERLIASLSAKTRALLARNPDDPALLHLHARLLRQLAHTQDERGSPGDALATSRAALDIYDRIAPSFPDNLGFLRGHAEALVRVGDLCQPRPPLGPGPAYYMRAHRMLLESVPRFPDSIGLRDDLYWSYDRLEATTPSNDPAALLRDQLGRAEALLEADAARDLSLYAVQHAHVRLGGFHMANPGADALDTARDHLDRAVQLGLVLTARQAGRGAFEHTLLQAARARLELALHEPDRPDLRTHAETLSDALDRIGDRARHWRFLQHAVLESRCTLAIAWDRLGQPDLAAAQTDAVLRAAFEPPFRSMPGYAEVLDRSLLDLRTRGLLPHHSGTIPAPAEAAP